MAILLTCIIREYKPRLDDNGNPIPKSERRPKRKVACMIGYCGTGYNGMQIQNNPDVKTIEMDLFQAFVKAGAVSPENADDIKKNGLMRAARTDKGVHAAGNVISCKLIIEDEKIIDKINENLPDQIRVWGIERTNKSFDCRKMCSSRVYEYLLPTYSLLPPKPHTILSEQLEKEKNENPEFYRDDEEGSKWWLETTSAVDEIKKEVGYDESVEAQEDLGKTYNDKGEITEFGKKTKKVKGLENERRRAYNVSQERLQIFREALKQFEGTHNFHNYTIGKNFKDPSSKRYMKSLTVSDPFIIDKTEWVSIKIHGQSFMLHQIRKMIAMATLIVRTGCPISRIIDTFGSTSTNIPKAPALGLLLQCPVYEGYNGMLEKFGYNKIDFSRYENEMNDFKMKFIYDKIYNEEVKENSFYGFFGFIDNLKSNDDEFNVIKFLRASYNKGTTEEKSLANEPLQFDNID